MKVGTDGVMLGSWCDLGGMPQRVLDIGTGTGLLALMVAQRSEEWECGIDAVEIDGGSYAQACENFAASPWRNRIAAYNEPIQRFAQRIRTPYDLIVSNPPYFENSLHCPDGSRTAARHADSLSRQELIECVSACLSDGGLFSVIIPHVQTSRFCEIAERHRLYLNKWTEVSPNTQSPPHRSMLCFGRSEAEVAVIPDRICVESGGRHIYSSEYIELTKEFYLKF